METPEKVGNGIVYDHTKIEDKHYFGGYLNLAENNIKNVLNALKNRFGKAIDKKEKEEFKKEFNEYFSDKLAQADYQERVDFLKTYFPVIHYIDLPPAHKKFKGIPKPELEKIRRAYFREHFFLLTDAINALRNFYTHYYHRPLVFDEKLYALLDEIFLDVVLQVKRAKMKNDKTRHLLKASLNDELEALYKAKEKQVKEDIKAGKQRNTDEVSLRNGVLNDAFYHLLFGKDEVNRQYKSKYVHETEAENKIVLSQSGLIFLSGMFLSRKQSEDMRSRIKGFKAKTVKDPEKSPDRKNNSLKYMATHWVFGYLSFKGVKHRISTGFNLETLLMQMVDELSKVPDEVYQTFTEEQKNQFLEDINEYVKEEKETHSLNESIGVHPVIRKRYEDKFAYFALRYLDEFAGFPSLRFQVHLGNYVHDRRTKQIEGTAYETERVVKEKITAFGKLSELAGLKEDYFQKLAVTDNQTGWEKFPNPSYNFVAETIPLYINLANKDVRDAHKTNNLYRGRREAYLNTVAKRNSGKPSTEQIRSDIDAGIADTARSAPVAILSLNELPALLHELLVKKRSGEELEKQLVQTLVKHYATIVDFDPKAPLPELRVTKKLIKSSNEPSVNLDKLIRAIQTEVERTDEKLQLIADHKAEMKKKGKNGQPLRKNVFTNRECGEEARWLADDLKRLMPAAARAKWRGHHHSQLQLSLALYEHRPAEAFSLLKEFWNFADPEPLWNEWIAWAFRSSQTFELFYEKYLTRRRKLFAAWAEQLEGFRNSTAQLNKFIKQQHIWSVFHKRLYIIDTTENQKQKLLRQPLVLPRGLFDVKPTYIKGKSIDDNPELYADWFRLAYYNQDWQRFYAMPGDYRELFERNTDKDTERTKNKYNLSAEEQLNLFKHKHNRKIRAVKINDLYLKLMAEDMLNRLLGHAQTLHLQEMYLTRAERLEKERKAMLQHQRSAGDTSPVIVKDSFVWSIPVEYKYTQTTEAGEKVRVSQPAIKLKDLGKARNFIQTEKVQTLLSYDKEKLWNLAELEDELHIKKYSYETVRREYLLKEIQQFEKYILDGQGFNGADHPETFEENKHPNFKRYLAEGILSKYEQVTEEERNWFTGLNEFTIEKVSPGELDTKQPCTQHAFLLLLIRNKCAHNQLPAAVYYKRMLSGLPLPPEGTGYSQHILQYVRYAIAFLKAA